MYRPRKRGPKNGGGREHECRFDCVWLFELLDEETWGTFLFFLPPSISGCLYYFYTLSCTAHTHTHNLSPACRAGQPGFRPGAKLLPEREVYKPALSTPRPHRWHQRQRFIPSVTPTPSYPKPPPKPVSLLRLGAWTTQLPVLHGRIYAYKVIKK